MNFQWVNQEKSFDPQNGNKQREKVEQIIEYLGTNESVFCSVVGSSSNREAISFPWGTATSLYFILSPRLLLIRLLSTYGQSTSETLMFNNSWLKFYQKAFFISVIMTYCNKSYRKCHLTYLYITDVFFVAWVLLQHK